MFLLATIGVITAPSLLAAYALCRVATLPAPMPHGFEPETYRPREVPHKRGTAARPGRVRAMPLEEAFWI